MSSVGTGGLARGALVSLTGQWVKYVVQIASVVVFSRLLDPSDVGLVTAATAVTGVAWVLADFGLSLAALQADSLSQDQRSMLFWANSAVGLVIALLVCALAPLVAAFYDDQRLVAITTAGSLGFLLSGLTGQFEVTINRAGRFAVLSGIGVASQVAGLATGVATVLLGGSYWGLVVSPLTVNLVYFLGSVRYADWRPSRPRRGVPMAHLYRFGGQTLGVHLVTYVSYNADSIAIGRTLGNGPLGLYNRAYQLSQVPSLQLASPLTRVFLPALSRRRDDQVAYAELTGRIQVFLGYVLCGGLGLVLVESSAVVGLALGPGWDGAVTVLRVLCLAAILEILGRPYYWLMLSWARTGLLFWVELAPRLVTIVGILLLVSHGIAAVAWALVAGQAFALVLGVVFVLPAAGLRRGPFCWLVIRPGIAIVVASAAAALVLGQADSLSDIGALVVGGAVWFAAGAALAVVPPIRADLGEILRSLQALRGRRGVPA